MSRVERSADGNAPARNGPRRSRSARRRHLPVEQRLHAGRGSRTIGPPPSTISTTRRPAPVGEARQVVDAPPRPTGTGRRRRSPVSSGGRRRPRCGCPARRPPTCSTPSGASRLRHRRSSRRGAPPMPMLPSASRTCRQRPCPGTGPNTSRRRAGTPRRRARPHGGGADVDAQRGMAAGRAVRPPAGPVRSRRRASGRRSDPAAPRRRADRAGTRRPASHRVRAARGRPGRSASPDDPPRRGAALRRRGAARSAIVACDGRPRSAQWSCVNPDGHGAGHRRGEAAAGWAQRGDGVRVGGGVHVAEHGQEGHPQAPAAQRGEGPARRWSARGRDVPQHGGVSRIGQARAPTSRRRRRARAPRRRCAAARRPAPAGRRSPAGCPCR